MSKEKIEEMLLKLLKECAGREGASDDDVQFVKARNLPTSREQKCLSACIGEDIGLVRFL